MNRLSQGTLLAKSRQVESIKADRMIGEVWIDIRAAIANPQGQFQFTDPILDRFASIRVIRGQSPNFNREWTQIDANRDRLCGRILPGGRH